jgi:WW domain-containing oxidoreductase
VILIIILAKKVMAPAKRFGKHTTALEVVEGMDFSGRTYFITGGNAGKGFETARALALRNAHVVLGCRSMVRAIEARGDILQEKRDAKIDLLQLDNADLQSVRDCADKYIAKRWPLHCLILNAGVYDPLHRITDDEFETTFQVNHLAHFLLTQLLTPLLIQSAPSRVVVVASESHRTVGAIKLSANDITWERLSPTHTHSLNSALVAYDLSKLCNILFAKVLHQHLSTQGVTVNSVHPGMVRTSMQSSNSKLLRSFLVVAKPWMKTAEQGAATTVYCAVSPDLTPENGGRYFDGCRPKLPSTTAQRADIADRLWQVSELMIDTHAEKRQRTFAKLDRQKLTHSMSLLNGLQPILEDVLEKDTTAAVH